MRLLGIDLGSREVKIVIMENGKLTFNHKVSTVSFYKNYCSYDGKLTVNISKLKIGTVDMGISTGYGRNNTNLNMFTPINEIKAHVYGAIFQTGIKDFILLDIGGQDIKAVKVEKGIITDLELNEKCAASCGRYLENMANVLEMPLNEMFEYHENPVELNSTCAVFSESELIGKIAEGYNIQALAAGVNYSLYNRLKPMLNKFNGKRLIVAGGSALNTALIHYLGQDYLEIIKLTHPQLNGAIGCCYYGQLKNTRR